MDLVTLHRLDMTIAVMQGNAAGMDHLDDKMIEQLESSELFKELTDRTLAQIVSSIEAYKGVLVEIRELMEQNGGQFPDTEPSISQQTKSHDSEFKSALADVFGGFNVLE